MALLIDGYNLLHASGVLPRGTGPSTLERARSALLNYLAASLDPEQVRQTTIVFDAKDAPRGVRDEYDHHGMTVRFARGYEDADSLLIELIRLDSAPRQLEVVSSDHQVQRAAKRRRARAVDSDRWCAEVARRGRRLEMPPEPEETKPAAPLPPSEVQRWLRQFGDVVLREADREPLPPGRRRSARRRADPRDEVESEPPPSKRAASSAGEAPEKGAIEQSSGSSAGEVDPLIDEAKRLAAADRSLANPFPPGYAEDLLEGEDAPNEDDRSETGDAS